jgi:hypothetical protein
MVFKKTLNYIWTRFSHNQTITKKDQDRLFQHVIQIHDLKKLSYICSLHIYTEFFFFQSLRCGNKENIDFLLQWDPHLVHTNLGGISPCLFVLFHTDPTVRCLILQTLFPYIDINQTIDHDYTLLHYAVEANAPITVLHWLVEQGAKVLDANNVFTSHLQRETLIKWLHVKNWTRASRQLSILPKNICMTVKNASNFFHLRLLHVEEQKKFISMFSSLLLPDLLSLILSLCDYDACSPLCM